MPVSDRSSAKSHISSPTRPGSYVLGSARSVRFASRSAPWIHSLRSISVWVLPATSLIDASSEARQARPPASFVGRTR
eukprot:15483350-Alexandrium_andersonii.AAC.1